MIQIWNTMDTPYKNVIGTEGKYSFIRSMYKFQNILMWYKFYSSFTILGLEVYSYIVYIPL